jgi:integration host factor subunit alpha
MNITKKYIAKKISESCDLSFENSNLLLDSFILNIKRNLNKNIKISKFGSFKTIKTKPRIGRNPKTLETFPINSQKKVKFNPSQKLKDNIN